MTARLDAYERSSLGPERGMLRPRWAKKWSTRLFFGSASKILDSVSNTWTEVLHAPKIALHSD